MINRTVALIIRKTCQLWWFNWLNYGTEILLLAAPRGDAVARFITHINNPALQRATSFLISTCFATVLQEKLHFFVACFYRSLWQHQRKPKIRLLHEYIFVFVFKVWSNWQQKRATCRDLFLNSDFVRFPLWIRQNCSATNKVVAGCEKLLQWVAERLKRCSTFCNKICTKSVPPFTDPRQTCFATSDVYLHNLQQLNWL